MSKPFHNVIIIQFSTSSLNLEKLDQRTKRALRVKYKNSVQNISRNTFMYYKSSKFINRVVIVKNLKSSAILFIALV